MKQIVKNATVIAVLITVCIIMCCITACNGDDYTGTYYCYKNGVKQENSWIKLEKNSWADDSGASGRLERKDGYIYCYTEIFGKEETLFWGTISDGVFYWTTGETIPSGDYLIIAFFSDNSDHHNKSSYNSDNDDTGNEDTGNTDNGDTGNGDTGNTDGGDNNQPIDPVVGYLVTFDASGGLFLDGSDVYRIRVAINSTLTEPASPKRAGYEFGGWFCRETNDKWSFSTDRVDGPTFLVARWTETVVDYDVTFHLNYGGGGDVTKKTENGYVTYSPTRDGYQFVGWFTDKQLNNGWNLNTKVTEQGLELYASWLEGEIEVGQLNAPVVSLSNHVFTWNPVPNAKSYRIVLVKGGTTIAEENQSGTFWVLGPEYFSDVAGTYSCTVKIRANGDGINTTNSKYVSKSDMLKIRVLDAITNLTFSNISSTLNWDEVENAEGYEIYFGNTLKETVTEPEFDMSGYDAGEYDVKVVAVRENWASSSKELKVDKQKLKTPVATIDYNVERQEYKIDWTEIRNADCYVLTINGEKITVEESEYTINNDSSDWNNLQDIELTIQAFDSSAEYLISPESEVYMLKKYYKITTATENDGRGNVAVTNGAEAVTLSFDINRYGSDLVVDSQTITADCGMIYPKIDISYGVFTGWYTTAECTNLFDFSKNISNDTKVYAGWVYHSSKIAVYEDAQTAESTAFSIDVAGNKYIYFSTLTDGTYTVVYNNTKNGAVYEVPITLYDAESDDVLHDTVQTSTETVKSFTFVGQAGHVYYLHCGGGSNFATSINLTVYGGERIRDGGKLGGETLLTYYGDEVSVTALNNSGYVFNGWYYEGTKVCGESTYTFSMPAGNVTYIAKWIECPVTLEKNISEAGSVGGLDGAAIGEETTIIATTNNGYTFIGWYDGETKVSDEASLTYTFIMTDEKKTYTAKWNYYTLTTDTNMPEAGTYTQKTEEKITVGESVTLTAVSYAGYTFSGWYDGDTKVSDGTSLTYTFNMPAESRTYTAKWTYYTLTTETNMPEAGTYTQKIEEKITAGESVTLTVNTNFCYTFIGWYDGDTKVSDGTNLTYTFKMPAENKTLTAKWQIIDEMKNFYFTESSDSVVITGIRDKTVTEIIVPDYVTGIAEEAFTGCASLINLTIPFVGAEAFKTSSDTYRYTFGYIFGTSGYTGGTATTQYFYYGNSTSSTYSTTYYIPSSLESVTVTGGDIAYGAFYGCSGLESITISDGITSIGDSAFYGCSGLTGITIGKSVIHIGTSAFSGCSSLESITIPFVGAEAGKTSSDTYQYPFGYIFGERSYTGGTATKQYYYGSSTSSTTNTTYYIPSSLKSVTVTGGNILYGAFRSCTGLTSVTIGNGVTSIGSYAFSGCSKLTSITIDNSVTRIGNSAFSGCSALTCIIIPDSVTNIDSNVFSGCSGLTSITIPDSVTSIGRYAFSGCSGLTSITIPDSVTNIDSNVFSGCSGLTSITIPDSVTNIDSYAFSGCSVLTSITIGNGVTKIGNSAFSGCSALTSIIIPDSVTDIGDHAFASCDFLTDITIGNGIRTIGEYIFDCSWRVYRVFINDIASWCAIEMKDTSFSFFGNDHYMCRFELYLNNEFVCEELIIPETVTVIKPYVFRNFMINTITIPRTVTVIGEYSFGEEVHIVNYSGDIVSWCGIEFNGEHSNPLCFANEWYVNNEYIFELNIPDNITQIKSYTFQNADWLMFVTMGDSVASIDDGAFYGCNALTSITIGNSVTSIGSRAFEDCDNLSEINYNGTMAQWNDINKGADWNYNTGDYTVHCTDGDITK